MNIDWSSVLSLIAKNQASATDISKLVVAAIAVAAEVKAGNTTDILSILSKSAPDAIPVLELVANLLFPGAGTIIEVASILAQLLIFAVQLPPQTKQTLENHLVLHIQTATNKTKQQIEDEWFQRQNIGM